MLDDLAIEVLLRDSVNRSTVLITADSTGVLLATARRLAEDNT
jgi:NAD(P)-dependent dehydrogenase (short-subunit alcohol dehydrogenase family)